MDKPYAERVASGAALMAEDRRLHRHRVRSHPHRDQAYATPTDHRCRQLEWATSGIMVGMATILAIPGNSLANPAFAPFHSIAWMTETLWATVLVSAGTMRLVALWINGRKPLKTPWFRMAGAFFGMMTFGQLAAVVTVGSVQQLGAIPLSLAGFGGLAVCDAYSLYRASYDARYVRR